MELLDVFDVDFEGKWIYFTNKSGDSFFQIEMKFPEKVLKNIKLNLEDKFRYCYDVSLPMKAYYKDCVFLLEHIEQIQHLIIKHNL